MPGVVADCNTDSTTAASKAPPDITLACGDGTQSFTGLTWSVWSTTGAIGSGQYWQNDCTPNCAGGTVRSYAVSVALTSVIHSIRGPVFSVVNVSYPNGGPDGDSSGTFTLPVPPTPSPVCTAGQVQPWVSPETTSGSFTTLTIRLTNVSASECHMQGFPGLEIIDPSGTWTVNASRGCTWAPDGWCPTTASYVDLRPHDGTASFQLAWQSALPDQTCVLSAKALVTPPDAYDHITLPLEIGVCGDPTMKLGLSTVTA